MEQTTTKNTSLPIVFGVTAVFLAIALIYVLGFKPSSDMDEMVAQMMTEESSVDAGQEAAVAALTTQSDSDEVTAIEADLEATDLSSLEDISGL